MRSAFVCLAVLLGALQALALSEVKIESGSNDGSRPGKISVYAKNKNRNVNDIAIGGAGGNSDDGSGDKFFKNEGSEDTDEIKINWSGDKNKKDRRRDRSDSSSSRSTGRRDRSDKRRRDRSSRSEGRGRGGAGGWRNRNSTTTGRPGAGVGGGRPTTTPRQNLCYCTWSNGSYTGQCNFSSYDVQIHCDKKGYSQCRALCTAAETINWESCAPVGARTTACNCPTLHIRQRPFEVPDVPYGSSYFWDLRYKTCWRQCKQWSDESRGWDSRSGSSGSRSGRFGRVGRGRRDSFSDSDWAGVGRRRDDSEDSGRVGRVGRGRFGRRSDSDDSGRVGRGDRRSRDRSDRRGRGRGRRSSSSYTDSRTVSDDSSISNDRWKKMAKKAKAL